ncbi:ABC transporter substrate-binding protein [Ruminococcus sp. HUN007]|jgi:spermidine/putrescine-binding protein|uniref:ABC transporter substrate-binding protein n=1 Tax=Ruminococcus sp. HUN007 TaxID=1514668 RepID=UPI0005D1A4F5|nr:ABC transporter substrate-binding protein [Ruminococcus sp. HUN007]
MKNFKKTLALLAALALSATAFYGCGPAAGDSKPAGGNDAGNSAADNSATDESSADSNETAANSDQLTILCWNANDSQPMVDLFCEKTGTDPSLINIKNFDVQGGQATEQYNQYLEDPNNDADIMFLEADWCLNFINDDAKTIPLSELGYSDSDFSDIYDYVVETGKSTTTGALKGISWQAAAGGYCYREDLAEKFLNVKSPDEMQAKVKDWDTFLATAKELKDNNGPAISATLGGVWQVYSGSRGSAWVKDGKLVVDDYCTNYAEFAHTLYTEGYVTKVAQWSPEWTPLGQTDDVMGFFVSTWGFGDTILTAAAGGEGGATFGKWKCVTGPSNFYWGGTWLAPAARINNKDLAKQFIDFFTINEEGATAYAEKQGEYMSNKKVMEAIIAKGEYKGAPVLGGQNQFEVLNKVADGIDMKGKITPYDAIIKTEFSNAVNDYCDGAYATVEEAMEAFKNGVAEQITDGSVTIE